MAQSTFDFMSHEFSDAKTELRHENEAAKPIDSRARAKERNGCLIAMGILLSKMYKLATPEKRNEIREDAAALLNDRNRETAMKSFDLLDEDEDTITIYSLKNFSR